MKPWMRGWLVNVTLIVALILAALWLRDRAATAEDALCIQRAALIDSQIADRQALARARKYRDDVDAGRRKPVPGITKADITTSINDRRRLIRNRERSIQALSILHC